MGWRRLYISDECVRIKGSLRVQSVKVPVESGCIVDGVLVH